VENGARSAQNSIAGTGSGILSMASFLLITNTLFIDPVLTEKYP
jgi:hypothetical protein